MAKQDLDRLLGGIKPEELPRTHHEAKAAGINYYYTHKKCRYGHLAVRWASTKACMECVRVRAIRTYAEAKKSVIVQMTSEEAFSKINELPFSAKEAQAQGLPFFWPREQCENGHIGLKSSKTYRCIECDRTRAKQWVTDNLESTKARQSAYKKANREKCREWDRAFYARSPEKKTAATKRWEKANPERASMIKKRHRALKLGAEGSHTPEEFAEVVKRQKGKCFYCGKKMKKPTEDHFVPLTKGGTDFISNIVAAHGSCNSRKKDRDPLLHMRSLGFLL